MNVQKVRSRGIVRMSALFAIVALAWQTIRTAARTRRLEHLTHAWLVAGPLSASINQRDCNHSTSAERSFPVRLVAHCPSRASEQFGQNGESCLPGSSSSEVVWSE